MAYTVLARRYRSSTFDEVVGQNHIAQTLKKAIASNRIAHAYLFCGTRGTGKTSTARIFAKALNCSASDGPATEPCNQCASCLAVARGEDMDVIEIDAASNTGVDNVRDLIENASFRPARSRFKIYIIDEVHMLSKAAFNALLKTLEEPPDHVKFILATTEAEKVLPTIQSRCQRYDFRNIPTKEIAGHLTEICKQENITADEDAVYLVAKAGAGSMRDALSLLDRLLSIGEKTLTVDQIEQLLGMPKSQLIVELGEAIGQGEVASVLQQADTLIQNGLSPESLVAALTDHFRNLLILRTCGLRSGLVEVPGVNPVDLDKQAQLFDPVALAQDIVLMEELRRQLRGSQAGRALLDATLVRLALADQFIAVGEALTGVDQAGDAEKKKSIGEEKSEGRRLKDEKAAGSVAVESNTSPTNIATTDTAPPFHPSSFSLQTSASSPQPSSIAPPVSLDFDLGDDDSLPAVGRVWEDESPDAPSLSEQLKQLAAASTPDIAPQPSESDSNLASLDAFDLQKLWPMLLSDLQKESQSLSALSMAKLDRIEDDTAHIVFGPNGGTFARIWHTNGKRDIIARVLSTLLGKPTGVVFEVSETEPQTDHQTDPKVAAVASATPSPSTQSYPTSSSPTQSSPTPSPAAPRPAPRRPQPEPTPDPQDAFTTVPITPDLVDHLRQDPLMTALFDDLSAQLVRVVEQ